MARATPAATRHAALLRGVNVNGITIKSADLKALFVELGFANVRTVLASGNVLFDAPAEPTLKARIEAGLRKRFGYDAWIVLRTPGELARVAADYPFERADEERHPYLMFGSEPKVLQELLQQAGSTDPRIERVQAGNGLLYWEVTRGESTDSPFSKLAAKARYKPFVTTRNLRTVEKLITA